MLNVDMTINAACIHSFGRHASKVTDSMNMHFSLASLKYAA